LNKRIDSMIPLFCGIVAYIIYELTNASGLYWGDGGEFIAVANTLGIGHPYGHPLFWLLGRISIMLSPSNPAGAMNHLVAIFSAATCVVIAMIAQGWAGPRLSRAQTIVVIFSVTGLYATASTVWSQASYVEVYNIQALFISLAVYFLDRYFNRNERVSNLIVSAYFFGIAVTLGLYAILLLMLPVSMWLFFRERRKIRLSVISISVLFFVLGLTPWLYLLIRSSVQPALIVEKIDSFADFLNYLGRKSYLTGYRAGPVMIPLSFIRTFKIFLNNLTLWGLILFCFSLWSIFSNKNNRMVLSYLVVVLLFIIIFSISIPLTLNHIQMIGMDTYFIPALILIVPILTTGTSKLVAILRKHLQPLIILPLIVIIWGRWPDVDISKDRINEKFTQYMVSNLPEGSRIFTVSDEVTYPLYYYVYALGNEKNFTLIRRDYSDTSTIDLWEYIKKPNTFFQIDSRIINNIKDLSVYPIAGPFFTSIIDSASAKKLETEFNKNFPVREIEDLYNFHKEDNFFMGNIFGRRGLYWFKLFTQGDLKSESTQAAYKEANLGFYKAFYLNRSNLSGAEHGSLLAFSLINSKRFNEAEEYAAQALRINPYSPAPYKAFYAIYAERGEYQKALFYINKALKLRPKDGDAHLDIANCYYFLKQREKARKEYRKGIELGAGEREKLRVLLFGKVNSEK